MITVVWYIIRIQQSHSLMCFTSIYRDWGQYCHNPSVNNKKVLIIGRKDQLHRMNKKNHLSHWYRIFSDFWDFFLSYHIYYLCCLDVVKYHTYLIKLFSFLGKPIWIDGPILQYTCYIGFFHLVQISFGVTNLSQVEKALKTGK